MASAKKWRPGRTLAAFLLVIAVLYGLVAAGSSWVPGLGLDLQGGTEISMQAENTEGGSVPSESIDEARNIIDQRVNGSGITSARVTTEGGDVIQVSIPGEGEVQDELAERVRQTAKLRFRMVACSTQNPGPCGGGGGSGDGTGQLSPEQLSELTGEDGGNGQQRADLGFGHKLQADDDKKNKKNNKKDKNADENDVIPVDDALKFMRQPDQEWATKFASFQCPPADDPVEDVPGEPLLTCDEEGQVAYLLSPAIIEGTEISDADFGIPQGGANYAVTLDFKSKGSEAFADATGAIAPTGEMQAITLDGQVISALTSETRISGSAQITGDFDQESAEALANNLKYGSLPLDFPEENIQTRVIGPTLAGNQLTAGLWAALAGFILVVIFSLLYYRALGLIIVGSLFAAGAVTYAMIVLLSETAGVSLDLPGIAGLIVGVGITADSFIIYYERIRDEMRDGRTMRSAVDAGWVRARNTCLASDAVALLAAVVLYIFATNEVKGFAFMLGLTTLVDVAVFLWFTHPLVKLSSRFKFFNRGHALSGMSKSVLGGVAPKLEGGRA